MDEKAVRFLVLARRRFFNRAGRRPNTDSLVFDLAIPKRRKLHRWKNWGFQKCIFRSMQAVCRMFVEVLRNLR
jgi:hypothetical protein